MIFDAQHFPSTVTLETDLVVVGAGAGGLAAAMAAAERGVRTLVLEGGEYLTPADMTQREEQMVPRLFEECASRGTADLAVKVHQGRGVGGSTLHNTNLCKRIPAALREAWARERGLAHLDAATWEALYAEVEALLGVSEIPAASRSRHNQVLERGVQALGWRGGALSHNRTGCVGSGFCELGCRYDAKNNASKVLLPRALAAGAEVVSNCAVRRVLHRRGAARGVEAVSIDPVTRRVLGRVTVKAQRVCLAASATGTAALLLRSDIADPSGSTGNTLRLHPALVAAGEFDEEIRAWEGIPQSYECTEFLDLERPPEATPPGHRIWVLPAFAHPIGTATTIPGHGAAHRALMARYPHLAVFTAMLHDHTAGTVRPAGDSGLALEYWPDAADRAELTLGLWAAARLLFAAGARRVFIPSRVPRTLERGADLEPLRSLELRRGELDLVAVHPMGSVPMGDDPRRAPVGSDGKHHHCDALWVADGSLFPSSVGVPPQLSIYALGLHVGRALA